MLTNYPNKAGFTFTQLPPPEPEFVLKCPGCTKPMTRIVPKNRRSTDERYICYTCRIEAERPAAMMPPPPPPPPAPKNFTINEWSMRRREA